MERRSDTESSSEENLGDREFFTPSVNPEEPIIMVSAPTTPESDTLVVSDSSEEILGDWDFLFTEAFQQKTEALVSDNERGSTSTVAKGKRVLPPWMDSSYQWGGGKWKEDGRKTKKKNKKKEEQKEEIIPFKEIFEALLRNSGDKVEEEDKEDGKVQSCVEILKSMGFTFP